MLKLVKIKEEDLEKIMYWRMLPEVTKYMYTDPKLTIEAQYKWYESISNDPKCKHWIIELDNNKIGTVNLTGIDFTNRRCSWGHYIADTSLRGRGIGKLIEYNIYDYVFTKLSLNKLTVEVLAFNEHAINLHKKCGSQIEGILRQYIKKDNQYYNVIIMGILRNEWLELREKVSYNKIIIEEM